MASGHPAIGLLAPRIAPIALARPVRVKATKYPQSDATVLGDVRLRYIDVPAIVEAAPPVVLLHGLASRIEEYETLVDHLRVSRRVIVMDLPGNGYSDKPDRSYTLSLLEDAVLELLDHLGAGQVDLAGGSLGGNLVLRLGHRDRARFRRLAAWAPAGAWEPKRALGLLARLWLCALFWPIVWIQSRFWYDPRWVGRDRALLEAFHHYREILVPPFARMYFELAREQLTTSLFPIAPAITQPTLVLWGDHDHALGMGKGVNRLARLLPDARLRVFRGAGHSLATEVPEQLARELDRFLIARG